MLGKLLGKKGKKSGYYLELSEKEIDAIPEPLKAPVAAVAKVADAVLDGATGDTAAAASAPAAPALPALDNTVSKASQAMPQEVAVPEATTSDPLELIRTALATAATKSAETSESTVEPFDYTVPVAKAKRRRPGPSMSPFKAMAKDMRKTSAGF